jgi:pyridinium-3,5-bisthiocarboxylic acid mononucleotide nickel chelatase
VLGACLDAGVPLAAVRDALGSLGLDDYEVGAGRVQRAGIAATQWQLTERVPAPAGVTAAEVDAEARHHHPHRHVAGIERLIARSSLAPRARDRAIALVHRLATIEAEIHGTTIDQVHLHEVGALDSIIDIVGGVFALEWFGADRIVASPLNLGSGTVRCAHGVLPVPAPATARLVTGVPVYQEGPAVELTTPTGALLVTGFAQAYGPMPPMRVSAIGYGAGGRELADRPNVLRLLVGEDAAGPARARTVQTITVLTFEIDDMNPQIYGVLIDDLLAAGALDVYYTAVQMKKNRPGTLVTVLAPPDRREALSAIVFRETTTLGVRYHDVEREVLARETVAVQTPWGPVPVKVARFSGHGAGGGQVANAAPEFDACAALARAHGVAVKDVLAAAVKAWLDSRGNTPRA